jgi:hypothetical protein
MLMANNVKAMTEQDIRELAEHYCNKNNFKLLDMKGLPQKGDYYLRYVIAHNENKREYATWLFNVKCGGLHHGHYFGYYYNATQDEAYQGALDCFKNY